MADDNMVSIPEEPTFMHRTSILDANRRCALESAVRMYAPIPHKQGVSAENLTCVLMLADQFYDWLNNDGIYGR